MIPTLASNALAPNSPRLSRKSLRTAIVSLLIDLIAEKVIACSVNFPFQNNKQNGAVSAVNAYLNYLVFDKDYNPDMSKPGAIPVTVEAAIDGAMYYIKN